jgi:membrane-associated phospholipid phosphatase
MILITMRRLALFLALLLSQQVHSSPMVASGEWGADMGRTFKLMGHGAREQFVTPSNLFYLGLAAPALWYSFDQDDRLSTLARSKEMKKSVDIVGELGVFFAFPLAQAGVYEGARRAENHHLMQFAMEYTATMYLALIESAALSLISIHERPVDAGSDFWETAFRGKSSFPSGHMIPYAAMYFKTLQFFGPWWSIPPLVLTTMASLQRVQDGKHYLSDVVGSFFLTAFASEGVRQAAGHSSNHPFYQWAFERQFSVGLIQHQGVSGPLVAWRF